MAVYTVRTRDVWVLGYLWQPGVGPCSMHYTLPKDIPATREAIQTWVDANCGDFSSIIDFAASIDDIEIPWTTEENEIAYLDTIREEE